jgi:hypothetical protein
MKRTTNAHRFRPQLECLEARELPSVDVGVMVPQPTLQFAASANQVLNVYSSELTSGPAAGPQGPALSTQQFLLWYAADGSFANVPSLAAPVSLPGKPHDLAGIARALTVAGNGFLPAAQGISSTPWNAPDALPGRSAAVPPRPVSGAHSNLDASPSDVRESPAPTVPPADEPAPTPQRREEPIPCDPAPCLDGVACEREVVTLEGQTV